MEKIINVNGKDVPFKATASTTRRYRQMTGRDLFADISALAQASESPAGFTAVNLQAFEDIAYIMAKQANPDVPDTPDEWMDQFDIFSIYEIMPQIVELWGLSATPIEKSKKK